MSFYDDMAATALELLAEFGAPVVLQRVALGEYDPATSSSTSSTSTLPTTGVVRSYRAHQVDGTRIRVGDKELVLSNQVAPGLGDKVVADGEPWSIIHIDEVKPAGTVIVYRLQIRA